MLKKLYATWKIGVDKYPEGIIVEYRDGFGIAINYGKKPYMLNIPADAKILFGTKEIPPVGVTVWKNN